MVDPVKRASENEICLAQQKRLIMIFFYKGSMTKDEDVLFFCSVLHNKNFAKACVAGLESSEELRADFLTKPAVVPAFTLFGLDFREHSYLPTSQAIGN
jgi:hypothetical protein